MVSALNCMPAIEAIVDGIFEAEKSAEEFRQCEYDACNRIKGYYRGHLLRLKLRLLNHSATVVQRFWRGYLGRARFRAKLRENVFNITTSRFHVMATKIQSCWRGYYVRKYIADYYSRKLYLQALDKKHVEVRALLDSYAEAQRRDNDQREYWKQLSADVAWARSHHYQISTKAQFGVYNSPYYMEPQALEILLQQTPPRKPPSLVPSLLTAYREDRAWKSYNEVVPTTGLPVLPPIKPQGPFRESSEVLRQRCRPWRPTLRVETDFFSVDLARKDYLAQEWVARLTDKPFIGGITHPEAYQPNAWAKSDFKRISYGNVHFRDTFNRTGTEFSTKLAPIPIFEKFGTTYSQGEV